MTDVRADNAARDLLARLIDEAELESAPRDEVRADLARLGIDPERGIRFSRRLAAAASAPASDLLAKSLAAEDSDREISELESADLDAVRAELSQTTPLDAAHAQRLANKAMSVAAPRGSSRRLWYGIGGAITAIAASILIVVNLSTSDLAQPQIALAPPEAGTDALRLPQAEAPASPPLPPTAQTDSTASGTAPASSRGNTTAEAVSIGKYLKQPSAGKAVRDPNAEAEAVGVFESFGNSSSALGGAGLAEESASLLASRGGVADLTVTAALILQPERAPEPLRHANLGKGELMARLSDAAHDRRYQYIVALVTLRRSDGTSFDGMLLHSIWSFDRHADTAATSAPDAAGLDARPPEGPTLGNLLGTEANQFSVIMLNAPVPAGQSEAPK